jgi:maltose-binding protein MalE
MVLDKAEDTLQWMVDFREKVAGGRAGLEGFPPGGGNAFYTGAQAQTISGVWTWFQIKTEQPDLQAGVYLRPSRTGEEPKFLSMEAWAYGISKGSTSPEQAWALTKFLTADKDGGGWFMQQQGRPSPVKEFNQAAEMKQLSPYWDVLLKALERSVAPATFLPVHTDVIKVVNDHVAKLNQEQATVRETVANIRQEAQRWITEFWATKGK